MLRHILRYLARRFVFYGRQRVVGALVPLFFDALVHEYPDDEGWLEVIRWWVQDEGHIVIMLGESDGIISIDKKEGCDGTDCAS